MKYKINNKNNNIKTMKVTNKFNKDNNKFNKNSNGKNYKYKLMN